MVTDILNRCKDPLIKPIAAHWNGGKVANGCALAPRVLLKFLGKRLSKIPHLIPVRIGSRSKVPMQTFPKLSFKVFLSEKPLLEVKPSGFAASESP